VRQARDPDQIRSALADIEPACSPRWTPLYRLLLIGTTSAWILVVKQNRAQASIKEGLNKGLAQR
jgi:hypothetical protein